jgi:predicted dehydrogenase
VHIEKPHAVNEEQLNELISVAKNSSAEIFLGFNRPKSKLAQKAVQELKTEQGPLSMSFFVVGHKLEKDHWYFSSMKVEECSVIYVIGQIYLCIC